MFGSAREVDAELRHRVRGAMRPRRSRGNEYLYHAVWQGEADARAVQRPETERVLREFTEQRTRAERRRDRLRLRLDENAPVNRAMMLGRGEAAQFSGRQRRRLSGQPPAPA